MKRDGKLYAAICATPCVMFGNNPEIMQGLRPRSQCDFLTDHPPSPTGGIATSMSVPHWGPKW